MGAAGEGGQARAGDGVRQEGQARHVVGWAAGLLDGLPLALGYFPTAAAFGLAARQAGLSAPEALLMSALVYAGASQFALVGMLGAPAPAAAGAALLLNLRHVLYGPPLAAQLGHLGRRGRLGWIQAAACAFGLTDEVFAVASARLADGNVTFQWLMALELAAYSSWLGGTVAGAAAGEALLRLLPAAEPALSFALPALFVALLAPVVGQPTAAPSGAPEGPQRLAAAAAAVGAAFASAAVVLAGFGSWAVVAGAAAGLLAGGLAGRWGRDWARG